MPTENITTPEDQVSRLKLRVDNQDKTSIEVRQLCGHLFKITEIQRALIEQLAQLAGAEIVNANSDKPVVRKPN